MAAITVTCMSGFSGPGLIGSDYPQESVRLISFKGTPSAGNDLLQKRAKRYRICAFTRKSLNLHQQIFSGSFVLPQSFRFPALRSNHPYITERLHACLYNRPKNPLFLRVARLTYFASICRDSGIYWGIIG